MKWPFHTAQNEAHHHAEEELYRKKQEATRMLADIFVRHYSMTTSEIVSELETDTSVRWRANLGAVHRGGGYFYQLVKELSDGALAREEIGRLVSMLTWPELRAYNERGAPSCLVLAAIRNPSEG